MTRLLSSAPVAFLLCLAIHLAWAAGMALLCEQTSSGFTRHVLRHGTTTEAPPSSSYDKLLSPADESGKTPGVAHDRIRGWENVATQTRPKPHDDPRERGVRVQAEDVAVGETTLISQFVPGSSHGSGHELQHDHNKDETPRPTANEPRDASGRSGSANDVSLEVSRMCIIESGFSHADCAAEIGVLARRAARHALQAVRQDMGPQQADRDDGGVREGNGPVEAAQFLRVLHAYSAIDHRTRRAKAVRAWPDGDVPGESAATNAAWSKLRAFVQRVLRGEVPDPTHGTAMHWCSRRIAADHERAERAIAAGRLRRVRVPGVQLENDYFAEVFR